LAKDKLNEKPLSTKKNETQSDPLKIDRETILALLIVDSDRLKL
jgi:hypothetical protein